MELGRKIDGDAVIDRVLDDLNAIDPDLATYFIESSFGAIYRRPGLDLKTRELLMVAALTVLGEEDPLKTHALGAQRCGATPREIYEAIIHTYLVIGWPRALKALRAARSVLEQAAVSR
ncbi:MAG: carboxymuconolactone decarboxylase family protein [bacterium]